MSNIDSVDAETAAREKFGRIRPRRVTVGPYDTTLGPITHVDEERARLAAPSFRHIEVTPGSATIGAEIAAPPLSGDLSDEVLAEIRQALLDYKVIVFREQAMTSAEHVGFARRFGELETHPFIPGSDEYPELVRFEKGVDTAGFENGWHHDVTWREVPSMGAVLRAVKVPATGGDTAFADMAAAYDGLDDDIKSRIDSMVAVHDYAMAFGRQIAPEHQAELREKYPLVRHPVVRTHPETGRRLLFVNTYFTSHIEGLDPDESIELVKFLTGQANVLEYQYRVHWEPDTVVFWDNRVVQHYAVSDYYPDVRIMERASIIGDRPA